MPSTFTQLDSHLYDLGRESRGIFAPAGLEAALADGSPSSDPSVTSRKERFGQKMLAVKKAPADAKPIA